MDLIEKGALFSSDGVHRFKLWRIWDLTKELVLFVMLNPSLADAEKDDNTIRKCRAMVTKWGYGGFFVGNQYSNRTPKPAVLWSLDHNNADAMHRNDTAIREMQTRCALTVVAWGNNGIRYPERAAALLATLHEPHALKLTQSGAPWHPSYMRQLPGRSELVRYHPPPLRNPTHTQGP